MKDKEMISKVGNFGLRCKPCVFDSGFETPTGNYSEIMVLEYVNDVTYCVDLSKDSRFMETFGVKAVASRAAIKASSEVEERAKAIADVELKSMQDRSNCSQPLWRLNDHSIVKLFAILSQLTGAPLVYQE